MVHRAVTQNGVAFGSLGLAAALEVTLLVGFEAEAGDRELVAV